jgi:hypothetical protein
MRYLQVVFLGCALLAFSGCGDGKAEVKGTVKLDGVPIEDGTIRFEPVDGTTSVQGAFIKNGAYSARVPFGKMKVSFSASKKIGEKKLYDTPDSPTMPITDDIVPKKYGHEATEERYEVLPGVNQTKDWDLSTK